MANDPAVETLAQMLYDASDPLGIIYPWSQRLTAIKAPWVVAAREQLADLHQRSNILADAPRGREQSADERAVLGIYQKHSMGARPLSLGTLAQETHLEPGLLISTLYNLINCGLIDEMKMFSGFGDQPVFRLCTAGRAILSNAEM